MPRMPCQYIEPFPIGLSGDEAEWQGDLDVRVADFPRFRSDMRGRDMAAWFNAQGITYAVLKYRMPNGHREVPLDDVRQGLRILHNYSEEWKITKVGVMGASIGGYIAGHAAIFGVDDARPDFQILLYPVISMLPHLTHLKSRNGY